MNLSRHTASEGNSCVGLYSAYVNPRDWTNLHHTVALIRKLGKDMIVGDAALVLEKLQHS